ncbi:MAG: type II toxin-antitoxin system HigA family antitoxin [Anaerolineae bacterium]
MTKAIGKMTTGMLDYPKLLQIYQPRPISNEKQYDLMVTQLNQLLDLANPTLEEEDMLHLLGTLIADYEAREYSDDQFELRGVDLIKELMAQKGLKQKDLVPIFKTKSIVSAVFAGKRKLTVDHINQLAEFFRLPHSLFFIAA